MDTCIFMGIIQLPSYSFPAFVLFSPFFFQVAERAHLLWNNESVLNLVTQNRQVILPLVIPALEQNTLNHWNQAVLNLTLNVKKIFCEIDEELVLACQCKLEEEGLRLKAAAEKRKLTWELLETAAGLPTSTPTTTSSSASGNFLVPVKPATCSVAC